MKTFGYSFLLLGTLGFVLIRDVDAAAIETITVQSVTYHDGITIKKDDGSGNYPTPHYSAANSSPTAYPCTSFPKATLVLSFTPPDSSGYFSINGTASDNVTFPTRTQQFKDPNSATYTVQDYYSSDLPANVHKITSVVWKYNLNGTQQPNTEAGTSTNPIYVTLRNPTTTELFHTVLEHACSPGGATTDAQVISNSWSKFSSRTTKNHAGENLHYYKPNIAFAANQNFTVGDLLKNKNGRCGAWADFFMAVLRANGVTCTLTDVSVKGNPYSNDLGFAIQNINESNTGTSGDPLYKWWTKSTNAGAVNYFELVGFGLSGDLAYNVVGISGQNASTPAEKFFGNHKVVLAGTAAEPYYDPSYGVTYADAPDMEWKSVTKFFGYLSNPGSPPNSTFILTRRTSGNMDGLKFQ